MSAVMLPHATLLAGPCVLMEHVVTTVTDIWNVLDFWASGLLCYNFSFLVHSKNIKVGLIWVLGFFLFFFFFKIMAVGTPCRKSANTCDLPEYCDGTNEFCPYDFYLMDGLPCENNTAYCYEGRCQTYDYQCRHLFAPGRSSNPGFSGYYFSFWQIMQ